MLSRLAAAVGVLLVLTACKPAAEAQPTPAPTGAELPRGDGFDFYVLALSWSPSYCLAEGDQANRQQCGRGRPYAFVVHGLWPQFEKGYPEWCRADSDRVGDALARSMLDLIPSFGLIGHQWRKHGSCTGMDQEQFFKVVRRASEAVVVPDAYGQTSSYRSVAPSEVEDAFIRSNPGLPGDGIAVTCDDRLLREVRICLTRELGFRSCPEVDRRACRKPKVAMPPSRG